MPSTGAPLGTPCGVGSIAAAPSPPTGASSFVRYVHAGSRDLEVDPSTGHLATMPLVRQRVLLAVLTAYNSSGVLKFGLKAPRYIGTWFERDMETAVRAAMAQLTDIERVARLNSVLVERLGSGRARVTIDYTDLTTGESEPLAVAL